jgi:hypothetical protein
MAFRAAFSACQNFCVRGARRCRMHGGRKGTRKRLLAPALSAETNDHVL